MLRRDRHQLSESCEGGRSRALIQFDHIPPVLDKDGVGMLSRVPKPAVRELNAFHSRPFTMAEDYSARMVPPGAILHNPRALSPRAGFCAASQGVYNPCRRIDVVRLRAREFS